MFFCTTVIFPYEMHTSSMLRALHFFMYTSLHLDSEIRYTRIMFYFFNPPIDYIFFRWIAFLRIDRCHLQLIHFTLSISIDSINELKAISDMMKLIVDGNDGGDRVCCSCSYNDYYWIHDASSASFFFSSLSLCETEKHRIPYIFANVWVVRE